MLNLISSKLNEIAVVLQILSVALAAPAEYIILPPISPQGDIMALEAVLRANAPVIASYAQQRDVRGLITYYAKGFGVSEYLSLELADIESDFNPLAKNPKSSATGLFQWLKWSFSAHCDGDRLNPHDNTICTMKTLQDPKGIRHWSVVTSTRRAFIEKDLIVCQDFNRNICEIK